MRIIVLSLLFIFLLSVTYAQTKTYVGVKAGGHVGSSVLDHTLFYLNTRTGFISGVHAGLLVKHFPGKHDKQVNSGIQVGFNYVQKGWKQLFTGNTPGFTDRMNYLEIPVEGIGYFGEKNKYFIAAGFLFEYLLSERGSERPTGLPENVDFIHYRANRDRKVGYGFRVSGGLFHDFSFGSIHFEGFFAYSISNFIDAGKLADRTPDISNLWVGGLSIGYLIPFGALDMNK